MNFQKMKNEYHQMEHWNPEYKYYKEYQRGWEESKIQSVADMLLEKSKKA